MRSVISERVSMMPLRTAPNGIWVKAQLSFSSAECTVFDAVRPTSGSDSFFGERVSPLALAGRLGEVGVLSEDGAGTLQRRNSWQNQEQNGMPPRK